MNPSEYAYAVGRIRANEPNLLSKQDYEQLITAPDKEAVIRLLTDKGWPLPDNAGAEDAESAMDEAWQLIRECAPNADLLNALIVKNDFANLKAAIKAVFSDLEPSQYFSTPCTVDPALIAHAVTNRQFDELPAFLQAPCREAYEAITEQQSGQMAETVIDKASLSYRTSLAAKAESPLLNDLTALECAVADIKIALRCIFTAKSAEFMRSALCATKYFDNEALMENADSVEKIAAFVGKTELAFLSDAIPKGFTAVENACQEHILRTVEKAKWEVFGPDPLIAFWICRVNEVRNARIILSAKENDLEVNEIRRRVRGTDV